MASASAAATPIRARKYWSIIAAFSAENPSITRRKASGSASVKAAAAISAAATPRIVSR
ncbi:MAG: hypothetical protein V3R90_11765 [Limibaculum sp.]